MADSVDLAPGQPVPFDIERSPLLADVRHGFFGSAGGVHQFGYGGPGGKDAICALRAAAASTILSGAPLETPHQVHSADVVTVGKKWPDSTMERPIADAVVTSRTDIVIGVVTADCGPILFADRDAGVVGVAHAGWRGAHGGVIENTIAKMQKLGAKGSNIVAVLGPTIARSSYEVDAAFRENFTDEDEIHFAAAGRREGIERWHFDLPGYILARLRKAGVGTCGAVGLDTYKLDKRYFSYRRAVQSGAPDYGRQLSVIANG